MSQKELTEIKKFIQKQSFDLERRLGKRLNSIVDKKHLSRSLMKMVEEIFSPWPPSDM